MPYNIKDIEGIGPSFAERLANASIGNTNQLLEGCGSPSGRSQVSEKTGLSESQLLKWANMADLMRVSGVGSQYAELLEQAGVDTIKELRNRNAENLATRMKEINGSRRLVRTTPSPRTVEGWISKAKALEPKITY